MKKINKILALTATISLIPLSFIKAETFTYTVNVIQPEIAVSITSTVPSYEQELKLDRLKPYIYLDTIVIENTGGVVSTIDGIGTIERTDGGPSLTMTSNTSEINKVAPTLYNKGTNTVLDGLTSATGLLNNPKKDFFSLNPSEKREFDLGLRVNADFSAAFTFTAEFNARAK